MVSPTGRKTAKQAAQTGRITAFPTVFRSLRETDADLTDILDAIADGVIVRNSNRKMLYANEAAARLLGYGSTAAIMSTSNEEFDTRFEFADEHGLPVDLPDLPSRQALRGIPSPEITLRFRNRVTGSTGWALVKSRPVLDGRGDVRLTVTIIHDITLLKQTESDLRQARDELERTTAERTGKLFEANAVLHERLAQQDHDSAGFKVKLRRLFTRGDGVAADEEATRADLAQMRITFNDTAARELGLPIAAIRALTTTAKSTETNSEAHRQAIEAINDEADLLDSMVRDLETATSCEREESSFALQSVNLKDVLAETKCFAATLTGDHPIMVAHPCSCTVRADRERIGLALRHLVENAAKFSAPGSPIELRAVDQGARIRIEIEDHGIGIDGADLDRIFGHFGRGRDLNDRRTPGAGLGLYLTRRILRPHGSVLDITSTPGEGTTVAFDLERAPDEPANGIAFFRIDNHRP